MRINLSNSCGAFLSVTGASRGYAFVEYETEREMRRAYKVLQHISSLKYDILLPITCSLPQKMYVFLFGLCQNALKF